MNIYDIAEKANVSIATVSRVLNNSDKVSVKSRNKVLETIDRLLCTLKEGKEVPSKVVVSSRLVERESFVSLTSLKYLIIIFSSYIRGRSKNEKISSLFKPIRF